MSKSFLSHSFPYFQTYFLRKIAAKPPIWFALRSSKGFIVGACILAIFTDSFLYGIIVPVLPFALAERAGVHPDNVGVWTTTLLGCYAGACLIVAPFTGWLTDYFASRRTTFTMALIALGGSTALLCVGSSIRVYVIGRILQGISSAFTWTAGFTLAVETVGKEEVGRTMGFCSLGMNLALLLGPLVGGVMFEQYGYYSVFAIAFSLIVLDAIWRLALIEQPEPKKQEYWVMVYGIHGTPSINPSPIQMEIPDLEPLLVNYDQGPIESRESGKPRNTNSIWLRRITKRLPPALFILRDHRLQVALWASFSQITLITSLDAVLPRFVHQTFSWGADGSGLIFIPVVVPAFLAPLIGRFTDRFGPKWFVGIGFLGACPVWVLLRLVTSSGIGQVILLCFLLAAISLTMTLAGVPLMAEITFAVESMENQHPGAHGPRGAIAQAYGLFSFSLALGLLVGPMWAGFVENTAGWGTMGWTLGLLSGFTSILSIYFTGGSLDLGKLKSWV